MFLLYLLVNILPLESVYKDSHILSRGGMGIIIDKLGDVSIILETFPPNIHLFPPEICKFPN